MKTPEIESWLAEHGGRGLAIQSWFHEGQIRPSYKALLVNERNIVVAQTRGHWGHIEQALGELEKTVKEANS